MHHFVYPSKDTFITNISGYEDLNFGLNEILHVGVEDLTTVIKSSTKLFPISESISNVCLLDFSGSLINSELYGTASNALFNIFSGITSNVSSSYFTGILTGSYLSSSISEGSSVLLFSCVGGVCASLEEASSVFTTSFLSVSGCKLHKVVMPPWLSMRG